MQPASTCELAARVKDGIRDAGGVPFEFPVHPIQESCRRPTAALDRNLAYLGLVEILCGYPFDGVVLTTGCDKTTPACLMAAATVNLPSIVLSGGPMLDSYIDGKLAGSGSVLWEARRLVAAGKITVEELVDRVVRTIPSAGHCNTMGTATSMNSLAEALGMSLPGCATIPAPYAERAKMAYETGKRIVEMVREDLTPSRILTRAAFENAIVVELGDRRIDELSSAHHGDRAAHRRRGEHSGLGRDRARNASAGERRAGGRVSWARDIIARAACRR